MNRVKNKMTNLLSRVRMRKMTPGMYTFNQKNYKILKINHDKNHTKKYNNVRIEIPIPKNYLDNEDKQFVNQMLKNGTVLALHPNYVPSESWIDSQNKYIESLNEYDLETAMAYTVRSFEWVGEWLRTKNLSQLNFTSNNRRFVVPLYPQIMKVISNYKNNPWAKNALTTINRLNFTRLLKYIPDDILKRALDLYVKDLHRIIKKAPPLPAPMYVFRGINKDIFKGNLGTVHTLNEFASASYVPQPSYAYHGYIRIKLLKGMRVLLLQGLNIWKTSGEYEILLNKGSQYIIKKRNLIRYAINLPNKPLRKYPVTDITMYN